MEVYLFGTYEKQINVLFSYNKDIPIMEVVRLRKEGATGSQK